MPIVLEWVTTSRIFLLKYLDPQTFTNGALMIHIGMYWAPLLPVVDGSGGIALCFGFFHNLKIDHTCSAMNLVYEGCSFFRWRLQFDVCWFIDYLVIDESMDAYFVWKL